MICTNKNCEAYSESYDCNCKINGFTSAFGCVMCLRLDKAADAEAKEQGK
jgi:hypothetical protein